MKENEKNDTLHALCYAVTIILTINLQGMPKICQIYAKYISKICSQISPKKCLISAQDTSQICPKYAQDMSNKCQRCQRCAIDIPKMC